LLLIIAPYQTLTRALGIWCRNQIGPNFARAFESGAEMHQISPNFAQAARIWCRNAPDRPKLRASVRIWCRNAPDQPKLRASVRIWCRNAPDRPNPRASVRIWCKNAPDQPKLRANARIWCKNAPDRPNPRASCPDLVQKCTRSAQPPRERPIMPLTARRGRRRAPFSRTETAGTGRSRSFCPTRCTAASGCRSVRW